MNDQLDQKLKEVRYLFIFERKLKETRGKIVERMGPYP